MAKLVLHIPGGGLRNIPLGGRITLGRRADNDVCLPYPAVSAEHAAIVTVLDDSFLEDMHSTNGTLVNGKRVTKHFLRDRDAIDIGRVQLIYLVDDDEVVAPLHIDAQNADAGRADDQGTIGDSRTASLETRLDDKPLRAPEDRERAPVDDLLAELMGTTSKATVAIDIPPPVALVSELRPRVGSELDACTEATSGVYIEVMNGPNAGQIVPMTKREFVLGHKGATRAMIRREEDRFCLVAIDAAALISVNGTRVLNERSPLAFGDTIDVAGVMLRLGQRRPL